MRKLTNSRYTHSQVTRAQSPEDATWEKVDCLCQKAPNLDLEDKVRVQGGVIDRNHVPRNRKPNPRYLD
jgi:hypothetical protein